MKRILENGKFQQGGLWFRKAAGLAIGLFGVYFIVSPFVDASY